MGTAINVIGLKKSFKNNLVLKDVNLGVERGKILALLGSNGAGKTTTINILTTLINADDGKAIIGGFDVSKYPGKVRSLISLTGQFAAVDDILTARENLQLIADLRHVKESKKIVSDLLDKFDLTEAADRRTMTFSGGMRRRLDIAMSLIGNPSIIFLDEPTSGLDPQGRSDMWQTIKDLSATGTTIFLTTQNLEEADELADKIALLHDGTIVASGSAKELKKLVPSGSIELTFYDEKQLRKASELLNRKYNVTRVSDFILAIDIDEGAKRLAEIFNLLRDAQIELSDFSQNPPTLDDVFFKITNAKKEDK